MIDRASKPSANPAPELENGLWESGDFFAPDLVRFGLVNRNGQFDSWCTELESFIETETFFPERYDQLTGLDRFVTRATIVYRPITADGIPAAKQYLKATSTLMVVDGQIVGVAVKGRSHLGDLSPEQRLVTWQAPLSAVRNHEITVDEHDVEVLLMELGKGEVAQIRLSRPLRLVEESWKKISMKTMLTSLQSSVEQQRRMSIAAGGGLPSLKSFNTPQPEVHSSHAFPVWPTINVPPAPKPVNMLVGGATALEPIPAGPAPLQNLIQQVVPKQSRYQVGPAALTAKLRAKRVLEVSTHLASDDLLEIVRLATDDARGEVNRLTHDFLGQRVYVEVKKADRVILSINGPKRLVELMTMTANVQAAGSQKRLRVVIDTYKTSSPRLFGFIPAGPKQILGINTYKRFLEAIGDRIAAADPGASIEISVHQ